MLIGRQVFVSVACSLFFLTAPASFAQQPAEGAPREVAEDSGKPALSGQIGLGVIRAARPFVGAKDETLVIPVGNLEYGRFSFRGVEAAYRLTGDGSWFAQVIVRPRFDGLKPEDSPFLAGMEERKLSLDAGVRFGYGTRRYIVAVDAVTDVLGRSDGQEVGVSLTLPRRYGKFVVTPSLGMAWVSSKLADYYYGVRPEEALPQRPAYRVSDTWDAEASVLLSYDIAPRWSIYLVASADWLGEDIKDSPIVDQEIAVSGVLGVGWSF